MTRRQFPYTKLSGALRGFVRRASLWEGADHLLSVSGTRFSEDYRRFYYRDIQALISQRCPRAGSIGVWMMSVLAAALAPLIASVNPHKLIAGPIAILCLLFVLLRIVICWCYSCRCFLQTGISREELPSLFRTWNSQKALEHIRVKIGEAQGLLPEEIGSLPVPARTGLWGAGVSVSDASLVHSQKGSVQGVALAAVAFVLLLVNAASTLWFADGPTLLTSRMWMHVFNGLVLLCGGGALAWSLLTIHRLRNLRTLKIPVFASLVFVGIKIPMGQFLGRLYTTQKGMVSMTLPVLSIWRWWSKVDGGLAIVLGIGGLALILMNWQNYIREDLSSV